MAESKGHTRSLTTTAYWEFHIANIEMHSWSKFQHSSCAMNNVIQDALLKTLRQQVLKKINHYMNV